MLILSTTFPEISIRIMTITKHTLSKEKAMIGTEILARLSWLSANIYQEQVSGCELLKKVAESGSFFARESLARYKDSPSPLPTISLTNQDVTRWKMAWRAVQEYGQSYNRAGEFDDEKIIVHRCKDWPNMVDYLEELPIALDFSAAALVYSGLHALTWVAHFDSTTAQLLWRISACVVMGGAPIILALLSLTENYLDNLYHGIGFFFGRILVGLVWLAYVLARGYLVIECFINLSHLPAEVYDVPTWSTYFPHIS